LITWYTNCLKGRKRQFVGNKGVIGSQGRWKKAISGKTVRKRGQRRRENSDNADGKQNRSPENRGIFEIHFMFSWDVRSRQCDCATFGSGGDGFPSVPGRHDWNWINKPY
jgi:hypothetical protein